MSYLLSFICDVQKVDRPGDCRTNGALSCSLDRYCTPTVGKLYNIYGMFTKDTKGLCTVTITYFYYWNKFYQNNNFPEQDGKVGIFC